MNRKGEASVVRALAPTGIRFPAAFALSAALALAGCAATQTGSGSDAGPAPTSISQAKTALSANNLEAAETVLKSALSPRAKGDGSDPDAPDLLLLRAELRIRQNRYAEAESDALTAMALVPPTTPPSKKAAAQAPAPDSKKKPPRVSQLDQRNIHRRLAHLYEDTDHDDWAEHHLIQAHKLCTADAELSEMRDCEMERQALIRIRMARGRFSQAEPLVLGEVADAQGRYGADDLRLSLALCHASRFYERQGKYALSSPLFARSLQIWKESHEEAAEEFKRARAAGLPSDYDALNLPRAGNAIFSVPCGLEQQGAIFYKLGMAGVAADALRYEQDLWAADKEAGAAAVAYVDGLELRRADPLDIAGGRHAVGFAAQRKGDLVRAESELRMAAELYATAWPALPRSERRYRVEDYLGTLELLVEILRTSGRFAEAIAFGDKAIEVAADATHEYDSLRLDTLLSAAKTFREMRDGERAEQAAARYLDAVVKARGDTSADYAWALRTISFAYLQREELDASQRMEMQAKAIWAKQSPAAPAF